MTGSSMSRSGRSGDPGEDLLNLVAAEFAAGGLAAEVIGHRGPVPAQLVIPIDSDFCDAALVCFLPGLTDPPVLQYIAALECDVIEGAQASLARIVALVNANLPLTGFEYTEAAGALVFRHMQAVALNPLDAGVIAWPTAMIYHAITQYGPVLAAVASGAPYDAAADAVARRVAEDLDAE